MMTLTFHLQFTGLLLIGLGLLHLAFPKRFHWREELARLSLINRQMFLVHCFFLVMVLEFLGVCCFWFPNALEERTLLGRLVCAAATIFWACRLAMQFFVYDSSLWRGRRFETAMHVAFSLLWAYFTGVFAWAWWAQRH